MKTQMSRTIKARAAFSASEFRAALAGVPNEASITVSVDRGDPPYGGGFATVKISWEEELAQAPAEGSD